MNDFVNSFSALLYNEKSLVRNFMSFDNPHLCKLHGLVIQTKFRRCFIKTAFLAIFNLAKRGPKDNSGRTFN